jgi:hypothetical protein
MCQKIVVSSELLLRALLGIFAILVVVQICLQGFRFWTGDHFLFGLLAAFSLGGEQNFPTYFSTMLLLGCSAMLGVIGIGEFREQGRRAIYWYALAFIFLFLSMDEMMMIHERLSEPVRALVGDEYAPHYGWVLPYGLLIAVIGFAYARFLVELPRRTALLFVLAGVLYVGGAIGFETLSGAVSSEYGNSNVTYVALQTIEEVLEMFGAILFLYALADYVERRFTSFILCLAREPVLADTG